MTARTEVASVDPETIARCDRNVMDGAWAMIALGPRAHRRAWPGAVAVGNGLPSTVTNTLFVTTSTADAAARLRSAREFFGRSTPWKVVVTISDAVGPLRSAAEASGMIAGELTPNLLLETIPPAPSPPVGLEIREVADRSDLIAFRRAAGLGFGIPRWLLRVAMPRVPRPTSGSRPVPRLFVGRVGGQPVASAALYSSEGIAGISFVATVPAARRRGYGAALTWAALEAGRLAGDRVGFLQATKMGRPVYEAMGFRWATNYAEWSAGVSGARQFPGLLRTLWYGVTIWS